MAYYEQNSYTMRQKTWRDRIHQHFQFTKRLLDFQYSPFLNTNKAVYKIRLKLISQNDKEIYCSLGGQRPVKKKKKSKIKYTMDYSGHKRERVSTRIKIYSFQRKMHDEQKERKKKASAPHKPWKRSCQQNKYVTMFICVEP